MSAIGKVGTFGKSGTPPTQCLAGEPARLRLVLGGESAAAGLLGGVNDLVPVARIQLDGLSFAP